ncbi:MAG: hypothetical protein D3924_11255, partial [Candidatus Electrothrix sp. AR4]|nr:hypothetical protein [Candidatus Electrothrix sp. AR4]
MQAVLEGFEDEATEQPPANALDSILDGFDDGADEQPADDSLDAVLDGFGTEKEQAVAQEATDEAPPAVPSHFSLDGWLQFGTAYNFAHESPDDARTDWRGFSRSRLDLQLDLTARIFDSWSAKIGAKGFYDALFTFKGRDEYTQPVLDTYEDELELREVYLQGQLTDKLDLKTGRQIVVWGKSDTLRVTDILNPLDMREPGITDIEDLRLPVSMTKLDYYFGDWELSGIAIHEIRFNKLPAYGHDFYPADSPPPQEEKPENSLEHTEWALSLSGIFNGWDFDLYYARMFNDTPHLVVQNNVGSKNGATSPTLQHERLHMFGIAYNKAMGNWLLKTEAAFFDGLEYANSPDEEYTRCDALIGLEYTGFRETILSLEFADRHIISYDSMPENPPDGVLRDMYQLAFRYNRDFLNDTLTLSLLAMIYGPSSADGAFERLALEYDLRDTVMLRGCAVLYQ